jgi:arylsulfatase A-like enzyme
MEDTGIKNVILILLDSLNRHFLPTYGNKWVKTPNIERLANLSVTFDQHYVCSAPCMPARHDIFTGWAEFLWRPWGPLEPWDVSLIKLLKQNGITTQLITDHYHYFERGGENYHIDFDGWEFIRGHENDPWVTEPTPIPEHKGILTPRYARNMSRMKREEDFLAPRTFKTAINWLEDNYNKHERFFLMVEEFDPHEPFHVPEPYNSMYDKDWGGPLYFWEPYGLNRDNEAEVRHIRAQYAGKLTMVDRWLGYFLDKVDDFQLWENTLIILMTDHGHYLGEHNLYGKPPCPFYQSFVHLPFLVHLPGDKNSGSRISALTSNIDIYATILDAFSIDFSGFTHSRSILPLARGEVDKIRDFVLYGYFGEYVNYTDGRFTYLRAPVKENSPLYLYSQRWSTAPWWELPPLDDKAEAGRWFPESNLLLFRRPVTIEEMLKIHGPMDLVINGDSMLFNIEIDEEQEHPIKDKDLEKEYINKLKRALMEWKAPEEHLQRLGLI